MEMARPKFWMKLVVFAALTMLGYTQASSNIVVSPLTESSFQDNSACIRYLNTTLAGFMIKLNRPVNATSGMLRIGKDVEEIVNKKLTDLMVRCRENSTGPRATTPTQMNRDGRNFYADQLGIQKRDFKPRLKSEMENIIRIDTLKAMLNSVVAEKLKEETLNKQQAKLLRDYEEEIKVLEKTIVVTDQSRYHEMQSAGEYHVKLKDIEVQMADAPRRYASLKAQYDEITTNYCDCQKCTANQKPSLAHYSERSQFLNEDFTTKNGTPSS